MVLVSGRLVNYPFHEKNKLEMANLMNIVGLELKSSKVEMVKLKKKKEFTSKIGQRKLF